MKSRTIAIAVVIVLIIAGAAAYYYFTLPRGPTIAEIKIGLAEPLTGSYAVFGVEARQAAELVIEDINNAGGIKALGGTKLRIVVEDTKSTVDGAKLAAERLVSVERVPMIVGAFISRHTLGMTEITERSKVLVMADAIIDYLTNQTPPLRYFFRANPKVSFHAIWSMEFVKEQAAKKGITIRTIAIVNEDSIFGKTSAETQVTKAKDFGWTIVERIEYSSDITDMTSIVNRLRQANPDVVFSDAYYTDAVLFAKTVRDLGFKPKFIAAAGATGYAEPDSIKAIGDAVEYYTQTYSYDPTRNTPVNNKFVADFKARYGKIPTEAGGIIAYNFWAIKEVLEKAAALKPDNPLDPDNLRQAFLSVDIQSGPAADLYPSGRIKFDDRGDNLYAKPVILQVLRDAQGNLAPFLVWPSPGNQRDPVFPRP